MNRSRRQNLVCLALTGILLLMASCGKACPPRSTNSSHGPAPQDHSKAVFIDRPITYCWQRPLQARHGNVQILLDSSGSMIGFKNAVPHFVNWIQHGVSQLEGSTLVLDSSRVCQFSESFQQSPSIGNCSSFNQPQASFTPTGGTNLHEAIKSSDDYALTFILTDGVAATGGQGPSGCAGGVDAACVARALRDAVHAQSQDGEDVGRGLLIIPLFTNYDGTFYTEEPITPNNFQSAETIQQIRADIGKQAVIQDPRLGNDGRLVFGYQGPRAMLLIVIARWADLGRDAVQALWDRTSEVGVQRIDQMKDFSSGVSIFSPIEVYPGFISPVNWQSLKELDNPAASQTTLDVSLDNTSSNSPTISVECPSSNTSIGTYDLTGSVGDLNQSSGCVPIRLLPAFTFGFRAVRAEDDQALPQFLAAYEPREGSYADLQLTITCPGDSVRICGDSPIPVQWTAYMNYAEAANGLASPNGHAVQQQVQSMSTAHPSREPHRIFAFLPTLENFYREVAQDQRSAILARLNFCRKR